MRAIAADSTAGQRWLMSFGLTLIPVCAAVGPCAGSKPPPPNRPLPRCSPSWVLLLSLLPRHRGFWSGSFGLGSVEGLTLGWLPLRGVFFVKSEHLWAELYLLRYPPGFRRSLSVVFSASCAAVSGFAGGSASSASWPGLPSISFCQVDCLMLNA